MVLQVVQDGQQRPATFGIAGNEIFLVLRFGLIAEVGLGSFRDLLGAAGFDGPGHGSSSAIQFGGDDVQ